MPFALVVPTPHGDVVHAANAAGRALGLRAGQRATDAMAIHRDLRTAHADPAYETRALERLAAWTGRWSPMTRVDGTDGVALDATGCAHLFGGETAMLEDMRRRLAGLGVTALVAAAPNHAAAHALARHAATADRAVGVEADALEAALATLPVEALRIDAASARVLRRLGLKTIGQLTALPRPALKKRFSARRRRDPRDETWNDYLGRSTGASADLLQRLDEATGLVRVPLDPRRPVPPPRIARGLAEPVMDTDAVAAGLRPLVERLMQLLERRGEGARAVRLHGFRTDGGRAATTVRLSRPTRDAAHVMRLALDRLDDWHAEFGFDALAVEAARVEPLDPEQGNGLERERRADLAGLVDRLSSRLGADRVLRAVPRESHVPERSLAWLPVREAAPAPTDPPREPHVSTAPRPHRLFDHPEEIGVLHALPEGPPARFSWRRLSFDVARVAGPERIAPEWWREPGHARARDYYRAETPDGRGFWLFREGFEGDERGGRPRWFMHGLFS